MEKGKIVVADLPVCDCGRLTVRPMGGKPQEVVGFIEKRGQQNYLLVQRNGGGFLSFGGGTAIVG